MSAKDALTEAFYLAITAPSQEQSERAVALAEGIARGLSEFEVVQAQKAAAARVMAEKDVSE